VSNYNLYNATITNGGVTETFDARSEVIACYGSGCSVDQQYKCSDGLWYSLGTISVDLTQARRSDEDINARKTDKETALDMARARRTETSNIQRRGFTCGSGSDYVLSEVAMEHLDSVWGGDGSVKVFDARTQTNCYWGGCATQNQFYYEPDSAWCKLGNL